MATFTLPNTKAGGSVTVQAENLGAAQQAAAAQTGVSLAQQQGGGTFGANTSGGDMGSGSGGGGATGGGGGTAQSVGNAVTTALTPFSQATSGVTAADLAERKREFDATLAQQQLMWQQQGLPELVIAQKTQAAQQAEYESEQKIAAGNLQLAQTTQAAQVQQFGQTLANQQQQFAATQGLNYLTQAAQLGGPADYFQQSNFLRGAQQGGQTPQFLAALQNNIGLAPFQGTAGGPTPQVQSMNSLAGGLTGGAQFQVAGTPTATVPGSTSAQPAAPIGPTPQAYLDAAQGNQTLADQRYAADVAKAQAQAVANYTPSATGSTAVPTTPAATFNLAPGPSGNDAALASISQIGARGGQALGPQSLEQLSPDELDLLGSGLKASGYSLPSFLSSYKQSRIGQTARQGV